MVMLKSLQGCPAQVSIMDESEKKRGSKRKAKVEALRVTEGRGFNMFHPIDVPNSHGLIDEKRGV